MFGRQSNQNNGVNVNTTFKVFFSDLSSLTVGAWNSQLSIRLIPCTGHDENGMRQYDQNRRANTALYPEKAVVLKKGIDKELLPLIKKMEVGEHVEPKSVAISLGSNDKKNVLAVELKADENGKFGLYLTLYQGIKEDNSSDPQNIYTYLFGKNTYVTDYDFRTGKFGGEDEVESEWDVFYAMLSKCDEVLPIAAHGVRYVNTLSSKFTSNQNNTYKPQDSQLPFDNGMNVPTSSYSGSEDIGLPWN